MKTCQKCKAEFEKFDGAYCPTCVIFALLWVGMAEPGKKVDFTVQMGYDTTYKTTGGNNGN